MKPLRMRSWFLLTGVLLTAALASTPATAKVVLSFTGTVFNVTGSGGASPPSGVSVGNQVSGLITYVPAAATEVPSGPSERQYLFPTGATHQITITIESLVWQVDLQLVYVADEANSRDALSFQGTASTSANFPGFLEDGGLGIDFFDEVPPFTLLNGYDLPDSPEDIDFGAAVLSRHGGVSSINSSGAVAVWLIQFDLDSVTLPVEESTWGEVKALFARP